MVKDVFHTVFGVSDVIGVEVRNIGFVSDKITLTLSPAGRANFLDSGTNALAIDLNPQEEKLYYVKVAPSDLNPFQLNLDATSVAYEPDHDDIQVIVSLPENFDATSDLGLAAAMLLAVALFYYISKKE